MNGIARLTGVLVAGTALVVAAGHVPHPLDLSGVSAAAPARSGAAPVSHRALVCPGPEGIGVEGAGNAGSQSVEVLAAAAPGSTLPPALSTAPGTVTPSGLPRAGVWRPFTDRPTVHATRTAWEQAVLFTADAGLAPGVAAAQRSVVTSGARRGLVTAACAPASAQSWLVGGGAQPGRQERVVLANPGPNAVSVDLTVLGARGPVDSPNGSGIVVAPYSRTVMLLDSIAGAEASPVVHVEAHGGVVAAYLNDTWLDGVVPRGGDDAVPTAAPSRDQVVPGVQVHGSASVRVAVPGATEAVVQTRVLTASGPRAIPSGAVTHVAGRSVRDIDLGRLPAGAYAVQVRADVPVVAGATVERRKTTGGPSDFAWSASTAAITELGGTPVQAFPTKGLSASLSLVGGDRDQRVTVTTVGLDHRTRAREVIVKADSVSGVDVSRTSSVWVEPSGEGMRAAVVSELPASGGSDLIGIMPLGNLPILAQQSEVHEVPD